MQQFGPFGSAACTTPRRLGVRAWRGLCLGLVAIAGLQVAAPSNAEADLIRVEYEGLINTFGFSSSAFFKDRPTTTISGAFTYDSDTPAIPRSGGGFGFDLIDYGFTIVFPDRADYVSTGISNFGNGNIRVDELPPLPGRVDMAVQGVFAGPNLGASAPTGSRLVLIDGNTATPASFFVGNTLPSTAFSLADLNSASMFLEWTNSLGGRTLASFNMTAVNAAPATVSVAVPEPNSFSLFFAGAGLLLLSLRHRILAQLTALSPRRRRPRQRIARRESS